MDVTPQPLVFRFYIEPAEAARAVRSVARWSKLRWIGALVGLVPFIPITMQAVTGDRRWMSLSAVAPFVLLPILAYLVFGPLGQQFRISRARASNPLMQGEQSLTLSPSGLQTSSGPANSAVAWSGIIRVAEDNEFYLFFIADRYAYYLPKRAIVSESQDEAVRNLVRTCAPDQGRNLAREIGAPVAAT